jgi:hypothetical protein
MNVSRAIGIQGSVYGPNFQWRMVQILWPFRSKVNPSAPKPSFRNWCTVIYGSDIFFHKIPMLKTALLLNVLVTAATVVVLT